jgi:hypothetical protein
MKKIVWLLLQLAAFSAVAQAQSYLLVLNQAEDTLVVVDGQNYKSVLSGFGKKPKQGEPAIKLIEACLREYVLQAKLVYLQAAQGASRRFGIG